LNVIMLTFRSGFGFGPSFQPVTYPYTINCKPPREKPEPLDVVPRSSGATELPVATVMVSLASGP